MILTWLKFPNCLSAKVKLKKVKKWLMIQKFKSVYGIFFSMSDNQVTATDNQPTSVFMSKISWRPQPLTSSTQGTIATVSTLLRIKPHKTGIWTWLLSLQWVFKEWLFLNKHYCFEIFIVVFYRKDGILPNVNKI